MNTYSPSIPPEELAAAYIESHGDRLAEDLPPDLFEYLGGQELADQIAEELERRVAAGELERVIGEDGKARYRPPAPAESPG